MKRFLATFMMVLSLATVSANLAIDRAWAACPSDTSAQGQILNGVGQTGNDCDDSQVKNTLATIVSILSYIVGVAAVIMIILAGFKYITSGGDSNKVSNAKNTLVYAVIGIIVAVLAQLIVRFVITQADAAANNLCPSNSSIKADDPKCKP